MKSLIPIVLFVSFCLFSCDKDATLNNTSGTLTGKWKLTETFVDPGDGSGVYHPVNSTDSYIEFKADSSAQVENGGSIVSVPPNLAKYSLPGDSLIILIDSENNKYERRYEINNDTLTIAGGCYEGCGSKFIKAGN